MATRSQRNSNRFKRSGLTQDAIAFVSELIGTTMFLFLGLGGIKTAIASQSAGETVGKYVSLNNQTIFFIATSMGLALLVTSWAFYRVSGGLFNPTVTLALFLVGAIPAFRACVIVIAQLVGGILGAALVAGVTPGGIGTVVTSLEPGMSAARGVFLEGFLTAMLVFVVLMLAAEKSRATFLAPVGIGLTQFSGQLLGTLWTGCGMNPARSFGPSVISGNFPSEHWIYWVGPSFGSLVAVLVYVLLKAFSYENVVIGQDDDKPASDTINFHKLLFGHTKRYARDGTHQSKAEKGEMETNVEAGSNAETHSDPRRSETSNDVPLVAPPMIDGVMPSGRNDPAN